MKSTKPKRNFQPLDFFESRMAKPILLVILIILYSVGIYAFLNNWTSVINLTPANLMISMTALILAHKEFWNIRFFIFCFTAWALGFGIEVIGIQTGFPFGQYEYHHVLGYQVWDTPLLIGVNWLMLLLATRAVVDKYIHLSKWLKIALAASLMLALDFLIEPVAIQFQFWTWDGGSIPINNYIAWWIIAFVLHSLQWYLIQNYTCKVARGLFYIQFVFFGVINLFS